MSRRYLDVPKMRPSKAKVRQTHKEQRSEPDRDMTYMRLVAGRFRAMFGGAVADYDDYELIERICHLNNYDPLHLGELEGIAVMPDLWSKGTDTYTAEIRYTIDEDTGERNEEWLSNGQLNRMHGPAQIIIDPPGDLIMQSWYTRGQNMRDGPFPAIVYETLDHMPVEETYIWQDSDGRFSSVARTMEEDDDGQRVVTYRKNVHGKNPKPKVCDESYFYHMLETHAAFGSDMRTYRQIQKIMNPPLNIVHPNIRVQQVEGG